ncbi:hypothetical protein LZ318_03760 [Saccharopolyspora indica]|uniref:Uncharacterized protein n=1 Tax=Saccharopolyspora kobensis TaxID=146035 RepID=A0A1H6DZZ4_9PSEU|nr:MULTISPECIES: hypothetical protein [Saccharopolyspora]MDA3644956.1 hypothetical protein [Saccharopolyspora indica]SEG90910.1 hypothetical protein SAMN02982929_05339 [Saccharopolyspora kobensis]SFD94616.1 hypothetical protein SAMN05216506_107315 [Saccharopolyspora kobensis]
MAEIAHDKSATDAYRKLFEECRLELTGDKDIIALQGTFDILAGKTEQGKRVAEQFKRCREALTTQVMEFANKTLVELSQKLDTVDQNVETTTDENSKKAETTPVTF